MCIVTIIYKRPLERMNRTLESQVAHVHGRMKDEYNLAMDQLSIRANRLNDLEAMAYDFNNETQQLRMENASLRKAVEATNEYQSMVSSRRDSMKQEESTTQAKLRGAEMYHNNIVTNKDGQIQTLRNQIQHLSGSESTKLQVTSEARTQLS